MTPLITARRYHRELGELKLREAVLRVAIQVAVRELRRSHIEALVKEPVIRGLSKALIDADTI